MFCARVRSLSGLAALFLFFLPLSGRAAAQTSTPSDDYRLQKDAMDLYDQGKMVDAMPLLERLAADHPKDIAIQERWGFATLSYARTLPDKEQRAKARIRARSILLKAKELGDNSNLLQVILPGIPEDGSESAFSDNQEVNAAMVQAEADFVRGDLAKARDGYLRALFLDPKLYNAALFMGDTFYKEKKPGFAGEWFRRAIEIDPDRETAYRYWGDALTSMGKMDDARGKFIEAVIADPYGNAPWVGLRQWAQRNGVELRTVHLEEKAAVKTEGTNTTITLDPGKKGDIANAAWTAYGMNQALWQMQDFKKEYPNEPKYRRSLKEEAAGLELMVSVILGDKKTKKHPKDLNPSLAALVELKDAGLLEPFVLISRSDDGIAQDYAAYRAAHRDNLRRYLDEFVVPKTPATK